MFDYKTADEAIRRIIENTAPRMVVVFGSVARHEATEDSDLDVLVVYDDGVDVDRKYLDVKRQFRGLLLPSDVIVMSVSDFNHYMENSYSFTHHIMSTGEVAYAQ